MSRPRLDDYAEDRPANLQEKTIRFAKDNPMLVIGVTGAIGIVLFQIRNFKNRGRTSVAYHIINTRLYAQGCIVLCLVSVAAKNIWNHYSARWFGSGSVAPSGSKPK